MRRVYFLMLVVFGMTVAVFGQGTSSASQTLKALLNEVHERRKDLQTSLGKIHGAQLSLSEDVVPPAARSRRPCEIARKSRTFSPCRAAHSPHNVSTTAVESTSLPSKSNKIASIAS